MPVTRFAVLSGIFCLAALLTQANGQEAGGPAVATPYYNIKLSPVYITFSAQNTVEYVDNVNLSSGINAPIQPDLIITPNFGIKAATQVQLHPSSETNTSTLAFTMNFGYREHVLRPELNQNILDLNISPDSDLSLVIHTGHFKIRLYDRFSLQSDPTTDGSLSNVAVFRRFTNTIGVDTRWNVNSRTYVNLNYGHTNLYALNLVALSTSGTVSNLSSSNIDSATDAITLIAATKIIPELAIGARGSVSGVNFPSATQQDSTTYSYGPFAEARLTQYTTLSLSGGITETQSGDVFVGSNSTNSSSSTAEYFDISLTNHLNTYYTQTLSAGRQISISLVGTQTSLDYLRYSSVWRMNSHIALTTDVFVEDSTGASGSTTTSTTNIQANYRRYGFGLSTSYQLSKKLSTSLSYRFVKKITSDPLACYQQNDIVWNITYRF